MSGQHTITSQIYKFILYAIETRGPFTADTIAMGVMKRFGVERDEAVACCWDLVERDELEYGADARFHRVLQVNDLEDL